MEIIDKQGRLFGTVNVVDALVVLLVLAVGLAGVALIVGGGPTGPTGPTETQYVTLDVGLQPEYVVGAVESGDNVTLDGTYDGATVTDTYFTPAQDGTSAVIRVAVTHGANTTATVDGEPLRIGRRLGVENPAYVLNGTVREVGPEPELPTADRRVVLRGTVTDAVASQVSAGEEIHVAGNRVATVEDVAVYDADRPGRRTLYLNASVRTYTSGDATWFGGTRIEADRTLALPIAGVQFSGTIERVGGGLDRTTESVLTTGVVPADVARQIEPGDTYEVAGHPIATVEEVIAYDTGDPDRKRIHVALSLKALNYGERTQFGTRPVEEGATLPFRTNQYDFSGEVRGVGTADLGVTAEDVLVSDVVDAEDARAIQAGDTYEVAGHPIATVEEVIAYDTGNPDRKRVYLGLSVKTLGYGAVPRFDTRAVDSGATLPFRTDRYELGGNVLRVGTADLQVTTEDVLVTDVVETSVAEAVSEGDAYRVSNRTLATVKTVTVYGTDDPNRKRVYVGLSLDALGYGERPLFGENNPLEEGVRLPFRTPAYDLNGRIVRVDAVQQRGQATTRTVTLQMENVAPHRARSVEAGLTETNAGQTIATVTNVTVRPAVITLTSEDGNIYEREHPVNKDVTLTAELRVRVDDRTIRFKGHTVQEGDRITLDLGVTTIRATIVNLDAA